MAEKTLNDLLTEIINKNKAAWEALVSDEVIAAAKAAGIITDGGGIAALNAILLKLIALIGHTHNAAELTGVLPVGHGGTGQTEVRKIAQSLFPAAKSTELAENSLYSFAVLGPSWADNGYLNLTSLKKLLGL